MARTVGRWAVAITLVGGSLAVAQPWPAVPPVQGTPPPAPRYESKPAADEPLFVIRTAGQSDRIVRVIHPAKDADGLAEVKDTASGQSFNIPARVLARLPRANATKPVPVSASPTEANPEPKPEPVKPPTDSMPQLPTTTVRTASLETVERRSVHSQPLAITPPPGEKMVVTWRAEDPPTPVPTPVAKPEMPTATPPKPSGADPWRASRPGKPSVAPPLPLAPVPSWKPSNPPKPTADPNDPWRPSGG